MNNYFLAFCQRANKALSTQSHVALRDCREQINFFQKYGKCYWRMTTLIFGQKQASIS